MGEFFKSLFEYLSNAGNKRLYRFILLFIIFVTVFCIDNILGFSYYYEVDRKTENISKLNLIVKDSQSDTAVVRIAKKQIEDISNRKSLRDYGLSLFRNSPKIDANNITTNNANNKEPNILFCILLFFITTFQYFPFGYIAIKNILKNRASYKTKSHYRFALKSTIANLLGALSTGIIPIMFYIDGYLSNFSSILMALGTNIIITGYFLGAYYLLKLKEKYSSDN